MWVCVNILGVYVYAQYVGYLCVRACVLACASPYGQRTLLHCLRIPWCCREGACLFCSKGQINWLLINLECSNHLNRDANHTPLADFDHLFTAVRDWWKPDQMLPSLWVPLSGTGCWCWCFLFNSEVHPVHFVIIVWQGDNTCNTLKQKNKIKRYRSTDRHTNPYMRAHTHMQAHTNISSRTQLFQGL